MACDRVASIRERAAAVQARISQAARRAGREASPVRLVLVTKAHPEAVVRAAVAAGLTRLGENYAEEALPKIAALGPGVEWHMIGHVQSRKARQVVGHFAMVHSVDSLPLAQRLDRLAGEGGLVLPILLEFNVSGETSKFGWDATRPESWSALLPGVRAVAALPHLAVRGLMTVAPAAAEAGAVRPVFRRLRELRGWLCEELGVAAWPELSMGMTDDFEVAVEEGATLVRIGRAILGPRPAGA